MVMKLQKWLGIKYIGRKYAWLVAVLTRHSPVSSSEI